MTKRGVVADRSTYTPKTLKRLTTGSAASVRVDQWLSRGGSESSVRAMTRRTISWSRPGRGASWRIAGRRRRADQRCHRLTVMGPVGSALVISRLDCPSALGGGSASEGPTVEGLIGRGTNARNLAVAPASRRATVPTERTAQYIYSQCCTRIRYGLLGSFRGTGSALFYSTEWGETNTPLPGLRP